MKVFVATLDEGSLTGASRKTGRSLAAVSRAVAFLEAHVGAPLLHRTTRSIKLSEAGERYAPVCRKVLMDLEEIELSVAGESSVPRGTLAISATVYAGTEILRSVVDAFMDEYPTVNVRVYLLDRQVNLVDEGIDIALRVTHLPDSTLVAHRIGEVRSVVVASTRYLASHPRISEPADLSEHQIIAMDHTGTNSWVFSPEKGSLTPRTVPLTPRLVVNSVRSVIASAVEGCGVTRLLAYHVAREIKQGQLQIVLSDAEPKPLPVHFVSPYGRLCVPKVRAFVDFALPRLRSRFAALAMDVETPAVSPITRQCSKVLAG